MILSTMGQDEHDRNLLNESHPLVTLLSFLAAKSDSDTMMLDQSIWEPDSQELMKAMEKEVTTSNMDIGKWSLFPQYLRSWLSGR